MKITRKQLRKLIKETFDNNVSVEVDVASDLRSFIRKAKSKGLGVKSVPNPGGWPAVVLSGSYDAVHSFLVNDYGMSHEEAQEMIEQ